MGYFDAVALIVRFTCLADRSKGGHRLVHNSPTNFACKLSINQCRTYRELSLDWSLLKTVVDWFAVSEDAYENGCTFPRLISLSC